MNLFLSDMLPRIAVEDQTIMRYLADGQTPDTIECHLPITFSASELFDGVWAWARESGVQLPTDTNWNDDFHDFYNLLSEPWPMEAFYVCGIDIKPAHKSNTKFKHQYTIQQLPTKPAS